MIFQLLQHLKLLPTTAKYDDPCPKGCNDWYLGTEKDGIDGILIYSYFDLIRLLYCYVFRCRTINSRRIHEFTMTSLCDRHHNSH